MALSDREVALAQFIKAKRFETRLRYSLMADAEIGRSLDTWKTEFNQSADLVAPQVLDLASEAKRLLGAGA